LRHAQALDVFEIRRALELEMVRLAALRRDASDLDRIRAQVGRLAAAGPSSRTDEFLKADLELYSAIAAATKNKILADFYASFANALSDAIAVAVRLPGVREKCIMRHQRLLLALERRDTQGAQAVTAEHLDAVTTLIRGGLVGPERRSGPPKARNRARR
jgi:DNA-binding FadR family transcriptional regulator